MIRSWILNPNFIGIYDNVLTQEDCDRLINQFERSEKNPGLVLEDGVSGVKNDKTKKGVEIESKFSREDFVSNTIKPFLFSCIDRYSEEYPGVNQYLSPWKYDDEYTFKKFEFKDDGFKRWHTEHNKGSESRILVWMFYLNDAKSGTEFMHYPTIRAKMGRCIIWPASWSHIHRSAPNKGLKYIISGWISYQ